MTYYELALHCIPRALFEQVSLNQNQTNHNDQSGQSEMS